MAAALPLRREKLQSACTRPGTGSAPGFLRAAGPGAPQPLSARARVANHSWVGDAQAGNSDSLRRLDWLIARDEFVNVVGLTNGGPNPPLLSSAYNVDCGGA